MLRLCSSFSGKDLYLSGGQPSMMRGNFVTDVWKFDGFLHTWTIVTQMPVKRRHHGTCASDTELFLLGGFGSYRSRLDSFEKYNTATGIVDPLQDQFDNTTTLILILSSTQLICCFVLYLGNVALMQLHKT